jgi:glycosyltransferase involved in cell wall biosynthesis
MESSRHFERRLRVVTLVDGLGLAGGAERLAREVVVRLDPERFEPTLCVSRWSAEREAAATAAGALAQLDDAGVRFLGLHRRAAYDIAAWRPLFSLLRAGGIDVLHAHKFGSNVWAATLGTLARTPAIVAHEHTWSFEGQPLRRVLDRRLIAARVDAFLAVSSEDRRRMIEIEGIDPGKLIFIPNGIPRPPPPSGADARAELGIAADAPVVGTVCALRPQKALEVLLDAAAMLADRFPALRVMIVGDGPERAGLERRIGELGLDRTVSLLGQRNDVPDLLRAFDVAVCCSDFEGTPLSILEYMEASLPVVATRVGGVPDLIESGVQGLLVERRDPAGLAGAVAELLDDPEPAARMGESGRQRQRAEFDIGVTVNEIERIYVGLAEGRSAAQLAAEVGSAAGVQG